jgi:hypothetical protein
MQLHKRDEAMDLRLVVNQLGENAAESRKRPNPTALTFRV